MQAQQAIRALITSGRGRSRASSPYRAVPVLLGSWLLLSGHLTADLVAAGMASAIGVVWLTRRMALIDRSEHAHALSWRLLVFLPWLLKQVASSAWRVTRIILDPTLPICPALVRVKPSQSTELGLVLHANSITLTPGTLTLEATNDRLLVHTLTATDASDLRNSALDSRVAALEPRR